VAEEVASPAGEEIEVLAPLGIPDLRSGPALEADREALVVGDDIPSKVSITAFVAAPWVSMVAIRGS